MPPTPWSCPFIQTFPCILLPWAFPMSNIEERFWQHPKDISSLTQISLPVIPVDKLSLNLWENLMLTLHNLSPQCVMFRPEVISVLEEKPKLGERKGFWNWSLGMRGIWGGMKMEFASSAVASKGQQQLSTCPCITKTPWAVFQFRIRSDQLYSFTVPKIRELLSWPENSTLFDYLCKINAVWDGCRTVVLYVDWMGLGW